MRRIREWFSGGVKKPTDTSVGGILLHHGFITRDQLLAAIAAKNNATPADLLGEVLIAQGAITRSQLERVLVMQREARGDKVDYSQEIKNLFAEASARVENLHGPLDELEDAARRLSVTRTDLPLVPAGERKKP